jgi:hypothetical protein
MAASHPTLGLWLSTKLGQAGRVVLSRRGWARAVGGKRGGRELRHSGCPPAPHLHGCDAHLPTGTNNNPQCVACSLVNSQSHETMAYIIILKVADVVLCARQDGAVCEVEESITNLCGFERALGRSQHVTLGAEFLSPPDGADVAAGIRLRPAHGPHVGSRSACGLAEQACVAFGVGAVGATFSANCDMGLTWPDLELPPASQWETAAEFEYPDVPRKDGGVDDWRQFPRGHAANSDLLTLRVNPQKSHGWFVAERGDSESHRLALAYTWERDAFPWLMTWEEM